MIDHLRALVGATGPAVIAPDSAEAAAAVLRVATEEGWRVRPASGWSAGDLTSAPSTAPEVVLTTERLAGIVAHEPEDMVVSAGAGTTLGALRAHLAAAGQWLPLDPAGGAAMTLGTLVAGAKAGPLREGYGTPRDHLLGLQFVTGDGRVIECGGRVVKNVAGYDLVKLLVGSRGTLGFVTRVDVRLRALPACDRTVALGAESPAPLLALVDAIRAARIEMAALELLSPAAWSSIAQGDDQWVLLARLQGNTSAVTAALAEIERSAAAAGAAPAAELAPTEMDAPAAELDAPWEELSRLEAGAAAVARLADRPAALSETLELALRLPGVAAGAVPVLAHAGGGIVRVLAGEELVTEPMSSGWASALRSTAVVLSARRGTLLVSGAPGAVPAPWLEAASAVPLGSRRLQRAIRERFDPARILLSEGEVA